MSISLYIHIPFCKSKCPYCDFYSIEYKKDLADLYIDVICKQLEKLNRKFYTIYIGGGTPTTLSENQLEKLLKHLYKFSKNTVEFTIEANPESLSKEKIKLFLKNKVNRISIGVQSFNENKLKFLKRIHTAKEAFESVLLVEKYGFRNVNIDLIFGLPNETFTLWKKDLNIATSLGVSHISVYILSCERKTEFYKYNNIIEDNIVVKMYTYAIRRLNYSGFFQYEISNFAKRGFESRHNLTYWNNNFYIGLGPSSFSYVDGIREKNIADVIRYINKFLKGENLVVFREKLSKIKRAKETASLKIRTIEGIDFDWFYRKTNINFVEIEKEALYKLKKEGLIKYKREKNKKTGIQLTRKGLLFADTVSSILV